MVSHSHALHHVAHASVHSSSIYRWIDESDDNVKLDISTEKRGFRWTFFFLSFLLVEIFQIFLF